MLWNVTWKVIKRNIFENNNIIVSKWEVIYPDRTNGSEIRAIQISNVGNWEKKKLTSGIFKPYPTDSPSHGNLSKLLENMYN